jgi:hypothetical protein
MHGPITAVYRGNISHSHTTIQRPQQRLSLRQVRGGFVDKGHVQGLGHKGRSLYHVIL